MKRFYAAVLVSLASLLNTGCSPEDAKAAKLAAAALKLQVEAALNGYADLLIRAYVNPPMAPDDIIKGTVNLALSDFRADRTGWKPNADTLQRDLAGPDPAANARKTFRTEVSGITSAVADLDAAATGYEAAWPFGTDEFTRLKGGVHRLTCNLREVARSFDSDATPKRRYLTLQMQRAPMLTKYAGAVRSEDGVAAAATLQAYRELLGTEVKANADVQALFVRAAQSSADLYGAIEAVETVTLAEVLTLIQRYAPGLSRLDESIDGEAIARKAGVALGKISESKWLERFATQQTPDGPKCK